jgi:hypothetical protein
VREAMSRVILVLGMHRSGTSLIARSLECLGVELGPRANWSGPDNPDFAEDQDILGIDQAAMYFTLGTWDSPAPLDWYTLPTLITSNFANRVRGLIAERIARHPVWGIKEPRMCRLLPFWRPMFETLGCEISVVHVVRHPMAVARSLEKRNSIPIDTGLALWHEYTTRAREDVDPAWKTVTTRYESMMTDPVAQIERIGRGLDLEMNKDAAVTFQDQVVDLNLWHNGTSHEILPSKVQTLWYQMRREAMA